MKTTVALADWDADIENTALRIAEAGFGRVVLCVEDRHVLYREENVMEAIDMLRAQNLEVHIDPWGIEGFSGESVSHPYAFYSWLRLAARTNADAIMLDEPSPHPKLGLKAIYAAVDDIAPDMPIHLAVQPERLEVISCERAQEVSLSAYFFERAMGVATRPSLDAQLDIWMEDFGDRFNSAWVQLWGIPEGKEWVPAYLIEAWHNRGVPVNLWAWEAFRTVSSKRAKNPDLVWEHALKAIDICR